MGIRTSSLAYGNNGYESNLDSTKVRTIRLENKECQWHVLGSDFSEKMAKEEMISNGFHDANKGESSIVDRPVDTPCQETGSKDEAAVKLQKVYKSFRTRRKMADFAVLVEEGWWKAMDFMELEQSSVLFFDKDKQESAVSRWSRAKTKAAKLGKGLLKNSKGRKLALLHWLEAIDPRHRYGHNLHFYYMNWLETQSKQPFFYWLDVGEGKSVNLETCPRLKLQQQCVQYLGPLERRVYEVVLRDGQFCYKQTGEVFNTKGEEFKGKWIFVLSTSKVLYVGRKKKGRFQHSSFLAGGATIAAGRLVVENGVLKAVWPHSGHYQPTEENFQEFLEFLRENNVDLTDVKTSSVEEDEEDRISARHRRIGSVDIDIAETLHSITMMEGVDEDLIREDTQKLESDGAEEETESHGTEQQTKDHKQDNGQNLTIAKAEEEEEEEEKAVEELLGEEVTVSGDSIVERMRWKRERLVLTNWGNTCRVMDDRSRTEDRLCKRLPIRDALEKLKLSPGRTLTSYARNW